MSISPGYFWEKYGGNILLVLALLLVTTVAFRAGQEHQGAAKIKITLTKEQNKPDPVVQRAKVIDEALQRKGLTVETGLNKGKSQNKNQATEQKCRLLASKNSQKYHLPNCKNAARIKENNRICFTSLEEAKQKGYQPAKCCHR